MHRRYVVGAAVAVLTAVPLSCAQTNNAAEANMTAPAPTPETGYVDVNGLRMYYESHGEGGVPLVVLHGAFSSIHNSFGTIIPDLSTTRQVIGFDYQGHGRTADIDRPMRLDAIAEDVVAALDLLDIAQIDLMGYSTGAAIALRIALQHPERVRKLIVMSATYRLDGVRAGLMESIGEMQPSMMYGSPWHTDYLELNPAPDFDALFRKKAEMDKNIEDLSDAQIQSLTQPVLLIAGDSDLLALDHLATFFRLVGGDVFGDTPAGLPRSQLAILPGTSHVTTPLQTEVLLSIIPNFLDKEE
jgi:pimeloyl-ACP methyl ester carboxylesterase